MNSEDAPTMTRDDADAAIAEKKFPRVTVESIKDKIASVEYIPHGVLTIALITMSNGFKVLGKSAPADERNYDPAVGERYAFDDAFRQLWPLEGYLLCTRLAETA